MTDLLRTSDGLTSNLSSMSSSSFNRLDHVGLAALAALALGNGCAEESGTCFSSDDCALGQVCSDGMCFDARDREPRILSAALDGLDVQGVVLGSSPRLVTGAAGVDVYFLAAPCGDLMRVRPSLGDRDADDRARAVLVMPPPEGSCFADFDIVRAQNGVDHAVMRQKTGDGASAENAAITLEIVDDAVLSSMRFAPLPGDRRGLVPRAAIDAAGKAQAAWAQSRAGVHQIELVTLPATSASQAVEVATVESVPSGLALTFDAAGAAAVYALDVVEEDGENVERLLLSYGGVRRLVDPESGGNIDATTCGGTLVSAYRRTSELHIGQLVPAPGEETNLFTSDAIDTGLVRERAGGDLAVSCTDDRAWVAHQSNGSLSVYSHDVHDITDALAIPLADDARALDVIAENDGAHVVWVTNDGTLVYAHIRL